jgi:serine protease Do
MTFARWNRRALFAALLASLLPAAASAQMGLKPKLYTSGSSLRRAFSDVSAAARKATVQVLQDGEQRSLGAIISDDGYILTKASECNKGELACRLSDGSQHPATLIGQHEGADLALLKIQANGLSPVEWASETDPAIGSWVVTPGPASIPEAIGIIGVGRRRIRYERVAGVLGIVMEGDEGPPRISKVFEESGAAEAGLLEGDFVEQVADAEIASRGDLVECISQYEPGDAVELVIRRGEDRLTLKATLTYPPDDAYLTRIAVQNKMGGDLSLRRTGFDAVIQHDSVLLPEDCGGPLVGLDGKAFGINIARAGRTESYAIPADVAIGVAEQLRLTAPASQVSSEQTASEPAE